MLKHMIKYPSIAAVIEPCIDAFLALGKGGIPDAILQSACLPHLIKVSTYMHEDAYMYIHAILPQQLHK
jgi:hypothetical protein